MVTVKLDPEEHKELFCRVFIDTHIKFTAEELPWPDLEPEVLARLKSLPIWEEAVVTESETAMKVTALGKAEPDPLIAEAISLQGYEESRHAQMLRLLTRRCDIPVCREPDLTPPKDPYWAFLRTGYGECFDSFFGFGLFALAKRSGFFTPALVEFFEPVMQEEARHILFIANWIAYRQAEMSAIKRPGYLFTRGLALWLQSLRRVATAMKVKGAANEPETLETGFTMVAHQGFGNFSLSSYLETCLKENDRRLAPYDYRLLRPWVVPALSRRLLRALGGKPEDSGPRDS
jgi:hypothetical protein